MKRVVAVVVVISLIAVTTANWQAVVRWLPGSTSSSSSNGLLQIRQDLPARYSPPVRVNLTPAPARQLRLAVNGPYIVRALEDNRTIGSGDGLREVTVTATSPGIRFGSTNYPVSHLEVVPESSPAIWVNDHKYRGAVHLHRRGSESLIAVNVVALEDYVASVIDSEMPLAFPDEARRAQAIVARTYVLYQMRTVSRESPFDVYATTRSQKYLGAEYRAADGRRLAGESSNSRQIALETEGRICTYRGDIFCTYFAAVCGGETTPGNNVFTDAAEPLQSVPCDWCRPSPLYDWSTSITRAEATAALKKHFNELGKPFGSLTSMRLARGGTPLVADFEVSDGRHRHTVSSTVLRRLFPPSTLPSPRFTVAAHKERLLFEGRGSGHGVGMCQWGARGMAESGKNCVEIIAHYYPGAQVGLIDSAGP